MKAQHILFLLGLGIVVAACSPSYKSVKRLQQLEEGVSNPTSIEELKAAIAKYDQRALDLVTTQAQEGVWYKMLGTRYLKRPLPFTRITLTCITTWDCAPPILQMQIFLMTLRFLGATMSAKWTICARRKRHLSGLFK